MTDAFTAIRLRVFRFALFPAFLFIWFVVPSVAHAQVFAPGVPQQCVDVGDVRDSANILSNLSYYVDGSTTLQAPWQNLPAEAFEPLPHVNDASMFPFIGSTYWLRFCLHNSGGSARSLVLAFGPPLIQELDFYPMAPGAQSYQTGNSRPFSTRDLNHPAYHFALDLDAGEQQGFYLRLRTNAALSLMAEVYDERHYRTEKDLELGAYGIFAGVFLGLILYNLMLYVSVRQASALWYIAFASATFSLLLFFDGRFNQYVLPDYPAVNYQLTLLNYALASIAAGMFYRSFLKLARYPVLDRVGLGLLCVFSLGLLVAYMISTGSFVQLAGLFAVSVAVYYGFIVSFYLLYRGEPEARYFLVAQSLFILVVLDRSLFNVGITERYYVFYSPSAGLAGSMVMLAYAVGRTLHDDKDKAQQQALDQLRISNELRDSYSRKLEKDINSATAEIRQKNEVLATKAKELEDTNKAKSHFFANISHEFRTPLTLIKGPLTSLLERFGHEDTALIKSVIRQSQQLQNLIDQLLTLSKFDSDALQLEAGKENAVSFLRHLTSQFSSLAEQKGITLNFTAEHDEMPIYLDKDKFQIVINNLLSNAVKFTDRGGRIDVDVSFVGVDPSEQDDFDPDSLSTDAYLQISITDTGCGIDEASLPYIFDRYFQTKQKSGLQQGTGIGLSLVRELVNMHVGQVRASSIEGVGSRFIVQLPLGKAHLKPGELRDPDIPAESESATVTPPHEVTVPPLVEESPAPELPVVAADSAGNGGRLLIVDDNADMRDYLCALLQPFYDVITADDGVHAEEVLLEQDISLVITDMMMPRRDGLALVELLRADSRFAHVPVIMLTARAGQEDKLIGLQSLADDYLSKPFDAKELLARIRVLLRKQQQMRVFYGATAASVDTDTNASSSEPTEHELIRRMRRIVDARLHEPGFGVEELARDLYMSTPTLRRRLAETAPFSPSEFIRQCRLEKARQLAVTGQHRNLGALAAAVGFNQAGYFARLYRQAFNRSPIAAQDADQDTERSS